MQNESQDFLRYFIQEEIYNVPDKGSFNSVHVNENPIEEEPEKMTIPVKGENQQGILIIVEDRDNDFLSEKDEEFLMQILKAVELNSNHVAIVNMRHGISEILNTIDHRLVICFIENYPDSHEIFSLPEYEYTSIGNSKNLLKANQLPSIVSNRDLKMKLWTQLKTIFNK